MAVTVKSASVTDKFTMTSTTSINTYLKFCDRNTYLLNLMGLWPPRTKPDQFCRELLVLLILSFSNLSNILTIISTLLNGDELYTENIVEFLCIAGLLYKYGTIIYLEKSLSKIYENIFEYWDHLKSPDVKDVRKYVLLGKLRYVIFVVYLLITLFSFCQLVIIPISMDYINPLNETRPRILVLEADYTYYFYHWYYEIWTYFLAHYFLRILIFMSIKPPFSFGSQQIMGLINIIKYRMKLTIKQRDKNETDKKFISMIKSYNKTVQYNDEIKAPLELIIRGSIFSCISLLGLILIFIIHELISKNYKNIMDLTITVMIEIVAIIYVFYLSWQSQIIIDGSNELFSKIFVNDEYDITIKSKILLKIMMIRYPESYYRSGVGYYLLSLRQDGAIIFIYSIFAQFWYLND